MVVNDVILKFQFLCFQNRHWRASYELCLRWSHQKVHTRQGEVGMTAVQGFVACVMLSAMNLAYQDQTAVCPYWSLSFIIMFTTHCCYIHSATCLRETMTSELKDKLAVSKMKYVSEHACVHVCPRRRARGWVVRGWAHMCACAHTCVSICALKYQDSNSRV